MCTLMHKSMEKLELPAVLDLLAAQAASREAKARCKALEPLYDREDILLRQKETSAACHLISLKGSPSLAGAQDLSASLARAERGGTLSPGELLKIAAVLRSARQVKNYAETDAVATVLDPYFLQLVGNKY